MKFKKIGSSFIFPAIGSYRSLHEKLHQVIDDLGSNSHSIICRYCDIWKPNRCSPWTTKRQQISNYINKHWANINQFFIQRTNKRTKERKQHCDTLVKEFIEEYERSPIYNLGSFFTNFKYGKEFRQHLKTGHSEVSSSLDVVIESEKKTDELFAVVAEKLKERIRKETEEIIKPDNENSRVEPKPSFDIEGIANHTLTEVDDINTWNGFIFKRNPKGERGIISNNKWFHLHLFDQKRADNLVTTLNNIVRNPEISADITNYHIIQKRKEDDSRKFNEQLTKLTNSIKLKAKMLQGKCDHCS